MNRRIVGTAAILPLAPVIGAAWFAWKSASVGLPILYRLLRLGATAYLGRSRSGSHSRYYRKAAGRQARTARLHAVRATLLRAMNGR